MKKFDQSGSVVITLVLLAVIFAGTGTLLFMRHNQGNASNTDPNGCVHKTFDTSGGGSCVRDIQTLVNPQAYGIDGQLYIKVTGSFDAPTVAAVKVFQKNFSLPQTGSVTPTDWQKLCQTSDKSAALIAAAKNAGCLGY